MGTENKKLVNLTGDPKMKGTEVLGKAANKKKRKKEGRRNSRSIIKLFSSWGLFKNVGNGRSANSTGLRLVGTDYVMQVPAKAEYTWQVGWRKVGFIDIDKVRRIKQDKQVGFKEVMDNIPEELRKTFEENIELFIVPRKKR
jgi:hypothetical protein